MVAVAKRRVQDCSRGHFITLSVLLAERIRESPMSL